MSEDLNQPAEALPPPRRSRVRPMVFGIALLLCGAVIGSGATMLMLRAEASRAINDPQWMSKRATGHLERKLDLTPEQAVEVRQIFDSHRDQVRAFRSQHGERAREMFMELQQEIQTVLTPDQAEKFRAHLERVRERAFRHHEQRRRDGDRDGRMRRGPVEDRARDLDEPNADE